MINLNIKKELHGSNGVMNLDINLSLQKKVWKKGY